MIAQIKKLGIYCVLRDIYQYYRWRFCGGYKMPREGIERKFNSVLKRQAKLAGQNVAELPERTMPRLVVSVSNICSLNCKNCNNLIPYFKNKREIQADILIADINKVLELVDYICILEFIGGEPFLYSEIDKLLNYAVKQEKIGKVEFTTNAIAKYKDSTLDIIQENKTKVFISISDYGELNAKRADLLKNNLAERGIECRFCGDGNAWWIDAGILEKYHKSNAMLQYNLLTCYQSIECVILWDGKLYRCGRAPALAELGVSTDKSNYFNIRELDVESGKGDLIEDFLKAKYAECCQYCKMSNIIKKKIVAGVQLERK